MPAEPTSQKVRKTIPRPFDLLLPSGEQLWIELFDILQSAVKIQTSIFHSINLKRTKSSKKNNMHNLVDTVYQNHVPLIQTFQGEPKKEKYYTPVFR